MPVWPKFVYTFKASLQTAATRRKLRQRNDAAEQNAAFASLLRRLSATSFWKEKGIESGMSYATFQSRVPLQVYSHIAPAVERMKRGEADVLWPGQCSLFGLTAGTSGGGARCLPMTDDLLAHFRQAGLDALLYYTARARHAGVFRGRHFFHGAPAALRPLADGGPSSAGCGEVSGIVALKFPPWVERHLSEPAAAISRMTDWDAQANAIAEHVATRDLTVIAGVPNGMTPLLDAVRTKHAARIKGADLQALWPNLECLVHTGALISPFAATLRSLVGANVAFQDVYAAAEAFIAAQDADLGQGLRVISDQGVFFEFVAVSDFDDLRLEQLGTKAVPLASVRPGIDYVIIVTTPGGLARYVIGDVVRFMSVAPPRLVYVGGTQLRLNAFGENVTEREITETVVALCQRRNWTLVNFHVAPLFAGNNLTGRPQRGSHEWWIELKPGTVVTPTGPQMAAELDADLQRSNSGYGAKRAGGMMEAPTVRLVMPGVFEHWLRFHQKWGGQNKMPRCRSDRNVADEFAHITNFARE